MNFDLTLYIFVFIVWLIYIANSFYQNRKMKHYLPNKILELLTIPFYALAILSFYILDNNLINSFFNKPVDKIFTSLLANAGILLGIILLTFSIILYIYANFFEKSFPSCITTKNNQQLSGIYKYVRHPSFYIFFFISFGTALCLQNFTLFILAIVNHFCLYVYYAIEENQLRKTNSYYAEYLKRTNRFFPTFKK